ncbi:hypothetical protein [Vulcanisaeta souniana]|uniref:Methyltransferase FkbM domain-containing protein n=1 Tax=Vulcanisaeta souniana JCM 11219 TaxID=1293586 RepID=A0A830E0U6_9CREN|nr:hypothetical protein [Vulcanisaeta souniana]BDR91655.1 hypothetical protein Vsou_07480 [Vulcanisaeta souniana JCM 11219]GGI71578.1 hypothetical protein GCM10007112_05460 [Vulcanisaeta souniana JCM 11219]
MKSAMGQGFMKLGSRYGEVGYFVVKFDCEGCEYSLLTLPRDIISYGDEHVMEVHGTPSPIIDKLSECGFKVNVVFPGTYSIIHFHKKL